MTHALDTPNGLMLFELGASLAATLGTLGLVLAIVGVYGAVSYAASQRTHEIGARMALGTRPGQALKLIFRQFSARDCHRGHWNRRRRVCRGGDDAPAW
jgi:hypothetical protein